MGKQEITDEEIEIIVDNAILKSFNFYSKKQMEINFIDTDENNCVGKLIDELALNFYGNRNKIYHEVVFDIFQKYAFFGHYYNLEDKPINLKKGTIFLFKMLQKKKYIKHLTLYLNPPYKKEITNIPDTRRRIWTVFGMIYR